MSWVRVASVDELTDDVPLAVDVQVGDDELPLVVVRHEGTVYAIANECSHGNVELSEGDVADCAIECHLHGSRFSLVTGEALSLPATQPVRVFPARIDGDDVYVDATRNEDF